MASDADTAAPAAASGASDDAGSEDNHPQRVLTFDEGIRPNAKALWSMVRGRLSEVIEMGQAEGSTASTGERSTAARSSVRNAVTAVMKSSEGMRRHLTRARTKIQRMREPPIRQAGFVVHSREAAVLLAKQVTVRQRRAASLCANPVPSCLLSRVGARRTRGRARGPRRALRPLICAFAASAHTLRPSVVRPTVAARLVRPGPIVPLPSSAP